MAEVLVIGAGMAGAIAARPAVHPGCVEIGGSQVSGSVQLLLSQLIPIENRFFDLKARVEESEQLLVRLGRREAALAGEQSCRGSRALGTLARAHSQPTAAAQVGQVGNVLLPDAVHGLCVAGLLAGAQLGT